MISCEKLTIVVPFYNGMEHLRRLESYYRALAEVASLIFVDDGSTDGSGDFVRGLGIDAHIETKENCGLAAARNMGADLARTAYLLMHDVDDYLELEALSRWFAFAHDSGSDLCVTNWRAFTVGENGEVVFADWTDLKPTGDFLEDVLSPGWSLPPHCYIIKKSLWDSIDGGDEDLVNAQDFDVWARAALKLEAFSYFPEGVANYLKNAGGGRLSNRKRSFYCADYKTALVKLMGLVREAGHLSDPVKLAYAHRCRYLGDMAACDAPELSQWFFKEAWKNASPSELGGGVVKVSLMRLLTPSQYVAFLRLLRTVKPPP